MFARVLTMLRLISPALEILLSTPKDLLKLFWICKAVKVNPFTETPIVVSSEIVKVLLVVFIICGVGIIMFLTSLFP